MGPTPPQDTSFTAPHFGGYAGHIGSILRRRQARRQMNPPSPPPPMPYPGLRPFEEKDHAIFFGREVQVFEMLRQLEDRRFLAVVGSSGCGKSSLVKAGLLAAIRRGFLQETKDW